MTEEWMQKTLLSIGLKKQEVEVYVFLVTNGPQTVRSIGVNLQTYRRRVYRDIKKLEAHYFIDSTSKNPAMYSAKKFEEILDLVAKADLAEANRLEQQKSRLVALWKSATKEKSSS
jgi:sugar-specific transcriptional regulator TrmB